MPARAPAPPQFRADPSFVNLPSEQQFNRLEADLRGWKNRGRKTWSDARRFLANAQVLAFEFQVPLNEVLDMLDTAASADANRVPR
jgi:hypothetical protein